MGTKTDLTCADITEKLCKHCAHCCLNVLVPVQMDDRIFDFFQAAGLDIQRDENNPDVGIVNAGACQHLKQVGDAYKCSIYDTRPKLCADYNCVAWAKVAGTESEIVQHALGVYNRINAAE